VCISKSRAPPRRGLDSFLSGSAGLSQILGHEIPVHQMIEKCLDEIRPPVLVIEIVGVLPHVAGQQRTLALRQGIDRVRRGGNLELAALGNEPGPAAAELSDRCGFELFLELSSPPQSRSIACATWPLGEPPPLGFMLLQKKVWFHTCAALLKTPVLDVSLYVDLMMSSSDWFSAGEPLTRLLRFVT